MINTIQNKKIIYPENTSSIISELMKKYQLQETGKELFDKLIKKENTNGNKTVKIIIDIAEGKIMPNKLNYNLQQKLNISKSISEKIGQDITDKIIDLIKTDDTAKKKSPQSIKAQPKIKLNSDQQDTYREPIG